MPAVRLDQSLSTKCFLVSWQRNAGAGETTRNDCVLVPAAMQRPVKPLVKHSGQLASRKANFLVMNQLKSRPLFVAAWPATLRPVGVVRPDPLKRCSHLQVEIKFHSPVYSGLRRWYLQKTPVAHPRLRGKLQTGLVP